MKAKKKPLDIVTLESLGIQLKSSVELLSVTEPKKREPGIKVANVTELVQKLKEAQVL